MSKMLTRDEAAEAARVCSRTIDRAIQSNDLRHLRIGRRVLIKSDDLAAWLERHASAPAAEAG